MDSESTFVPCPDQEFLWNFAYSENDSESRHGDRWRTALGPRLSGLIQAGERSSLTRDDWSRVGIAMEAARGAYIAALIRLRPRWHVGILPTSGLGAIRLIRLEAFRSVSPRLRLDEFVRGLDAGKNTLDDQFSLRYRRLRPKFDPSRSRGIPMLVAAHLPGPFTEIDGLTRMCIIFSRLTQGESAPADIRVLLGLSQRITEWPFY